MSQQPCDRIWVCDGERSLCWQECDDWDRATMLACLSSDPRSLEELALAWSRYRPDQPLMELPWRESSGPPEAGEWLAIDLVAQRFAWRDPDNLAAEPGCYQPDDVDVSGRNRLAWINVPPWWKVILPENWAFEPSPAADGGGLQEAAQAHAIAAESQVRAQPFDFRSVLYGRPLIQYVAEQAIGCHANEEDSIARRKPAKRRQDKSLTAAEERAHSRDGLTAEERAQVQRWDKAAKRIHARWLMTPRGELAGKRPRAFLHADRRWKDRELEQRRSQWSRERRPPPPAPRTSNLFLYGPMGTEEVISYFELCRHLASIALQLVDDQPRVPLSQLTERLERVRDEWLASEAIEGDCMTVQEVIDGERQLIPRIASSDPFDCNCPLCRISELEPELFGPAFWISDTYREEMEEEFVFSLHAKRDDWEAAREEWIAWSDSTSHRRDSAEDSDQDSDQGSDQGSDRDGDGRPSAAGASSIGSSEGEWPSVWQSSFNDMSHDDPRLSLLGIGAHLTEIIDELQRIGAAHEEIEQLNRAFDRLGHSIRKWLTREPTAVHIPEFDSFESAATEMVRSLEAAGLKHEQLTARSADLQSQIHQWHRQLSP